MADIELECDVRIIQRATGFFSFWNRYREARLRILAPFLTIFDLNTQEIILSVDLSKENFQVGKLLDYKNGVALQKNDQISLEFQLDDETTQLTVIKSLSKAAFVNKPRKMPKSNEILSSLATQKSNSNFDLTWLSHGLHPRPFASGSMNILKSAHASGSFQSIHSGSKTPSPHESGEIGRDSVSFYEAAITLIVLKRSVRTRWRIIEHGAAIMIQSNYRRWIAQHKFAEEREKIILAQTQVRGFLARKHKEALIVEKYRNKLQIHRHQVMQEIYTTEVSYVQQLDNLIKIYIKPLRALEKKAGVTAEQIGILFSNVEEIHEKHVAFAEALAPLANNFTSETVLSAAFLQMATFLGVYVPFCNNFDESKAMLQKCQKIDKFSAFLETVDATKALQKQDLNSFLILPVQRIPRYELLLKDLIRHTWKEHPDYNNLEYALVKIHECAKNVNRLKSFNESRHRLAHLQIHISGSSAKLAGSMGRLTSNHSLSSINSPAGALSPNDLEDMYIGEGPLTYVEVERKVTNKSVMTENPTDIDAILSGSDPDLNNGTEGVIYEFKQTGQHVLVYAYLFQNTLVLTKRQKNEGTQGFFKGKKTVKNLTIKQAHLLNIALDRAAVELFRTNSSLVDSSLNRKDAEPAFMITSFGNKFYKFTAETHESKRKWIEDIKEAIQQCKKNRLSEASDITDFISAGSSAENIKEETEIVISVADSDSHDAQSVASKSSKELPPKVSGRSPMLLRKLFKSHDVLDKSPSASRKAKNSTSSTNSNGFLAPPSK